MARSRTPLMFTLLPMLASCVAPARTAPPPAVAAPAPPERPAPPVADRYAGDWSTADLPPGDWTYSRTPRASFALFAAERGAPLAMIECQGRAIRIARAGTIPVGSRAIMRVRTSFAERSLPLHNDVDARMVASSLDGRDPLFDQIIYSRGRFLIETSNQQPLLVPVRPEIARVVEDCRV